MIAEIEGKLGEISVLVNNAGSSPLYFHFISFFYLFTYVSNIIILFIYLGIAPQKKIEELTEEIFDETMTVNVKSVFLVTQAVLPKMRTAKWGRIINMSSVAAYIGNIEIISFFV
jgi:NAD(P)-dependent dehydrogenase (short-subunit alcohol dehydrogenase family)